MATRCPLWQFQNLPSILTLLLLHLSPSLAAITRVNYLSYYTKHCKDIVPESPITEHRPAFYKETGVGKDSILHFEDAHVRGGGRLFPPFRSASSDWDPPGTQLSFEPEWESFFLAEADNVVSFHASLTFKVHPLSYYNTTVDWGSAGPGIMFELDGFWSMTSGKLCMVGSEAIPNEPTYISKYDVALKLNFPVKFCDYKSLITGELESLNDWATSTYFGLVSILGLPRCEKYSYKLVNEANWSSCLNSNAKKEENLHLDITRTKLCLDQLHDYSISYHLEYGLECLDTSANDRSKCNPLGETSGGLPRFLAIKELSCDGHHGIRVLLVFSKVLPYPIGILQRAFDPETMLVGEASWNLSDQRLYVVASRVVNFKSSLSNASIGSSLIQLSLRVPSFMDIRNRFTVEGKIVVSSTNVSKDSDCFNTVKFHGSESLVAELGVGYVYTQLERVSKYCPAHKPGKGKQEYPHDHYGFGLNVANDKGQTLWTGYSTPLFVNNEPYELGSNKSLCHGHVNLSYSINIKPRFKLPKIQPWNDSVDFFAEGTYDCETGNLCLLGCLRFSSDIKRLRNNDSMDCEVLINTRFPALNGDGMMRGSIKSLRTRSDPLYFEPLLLSEYILYGTQKVKVIRFMDMDIAMVLICNSLACVFIGLQLLYVRRHPEALPHISFVMLTILTLSYMISLLINFEGFILTTSYHHHHTLFGKVGWLEAKEVIRVVTMLALLLQFHLLQLAWFSKTRAATHSRLWQSERRTVYVLLPLYVAGAVIFWFVPQGRSSNRYGPRKELTYKHDQPWDFLKSYAALVMDLFLLPQIIFNCWLNSTGSVLATSFYTGTTLARFVPHAYNFYWSRAFRWFANLQYVFLTNRRKFSTDWDIVSPILGIALAVIIFLQQRYGGLSILPIRKRQISEYENVPFASLVEDEMEVDLQ